MRFGHCPADGRQYLRKEKACIAQANAKNWVLTENVKPGLPEDGPLAKKQFVGQVVEARFL